MVTDTGLHGFSRVTSLGKGVLAQYRLRERIKNELPPVDWTQTLIDVIDMRSFSNIWYWIVLAVVWSTASHWVLGVPYDVIMRARRKGGEAYQDMEDIVRVNVNRILYISEVSGMWILGFVMFVMTALITLAFWYWIEFAQSVVLLAVPMCFVGALTVYTARKLKEENPEGAPLFKRLIRHRFWTQVIGMVSIFVTAMFGMFHNLSVIQQFEFFAP